MSLDEYSCQGGMGLDGCTIALITSPFLPHFVQRPTSKCLNTLTYGFCQAAADSRGSEGQPPDYNCVAVPFESASLCRCSFSLVVAIFDLAASGAVHDLTTVRKQAPTHSSFLLSLLESSVKQKPTNRGNLKHTHINRCVINMSALSTRQTA